MITSSSPGRAVSAHDEAGPGSACTKKSRSTSTPSGVARGNGVKSREIEARSGRVMPSSPGPDRGGRDQLAGGGIREEDPHVIGGTRAGEVAELGPRHRDPDDRRGDALHAQHAWPAAP